MMRFYTLLVCIAFSLAQTCSGQKIMSQHLLEHMVDSTEFKTAKLLNLINKRYHKKLTLEQIVPAESIVRISQWIDEYHQEQARDTVDDGNQDSGFGYYLACLDSIPRLLTQSLYKNLKKARVIDTVPDVSTLKAGDIIIVGRHSYENSLGSYQVNISSQYPQKQIKAIQQLAKFELWEGHYEYDDFKIMDGIKETFGTWQRAYNNQIDQGVRIHFKRLAALNNPTLTGSMSVFLTNLVIIKSIQPDQFNIGYQIEGYCSNFYQPILLNVNEGAIYLACRLH